MGTTEWLVEPDAEVVQCHPRRQARAQSLKLMEPTASPSEDGSESGITLVFKPLFPHFAPEALESMKHSGMFALSELGKLEDVLDAANLTVHEDDEIDSPIVFDDASGTVRTFMGAGPTALAIGHSGEQAVARAVRDALGPFTGTDGRMILPTWYLVVLT